MIAIDAYSIVTVVETGESGARPRAIAMCEDPATAKRVAAALNSVPALEALADGKPVQLLSLDQIDEELAAAFRAGWRRAAASLPPSLKVPLSPTAIAEEYAEFRKVGV